MRWAEMRMRELKEILGADKALKRSKYAEIARKYIERVPKIRRHELRPWHAAEAEKNILKLWFYTMKRRGIS